MIIGFTGPKGSGKTTIARELSKLLHLQVVPFALPIKAIVYKYLGMALSKDLPYLSHFYQDISPDRFFEEFERLLKGTLTEEEKKTILELFQNYQKTKDDLYARRVLQFVGTDVGRKRNPDIWVEYHREHTGGRSCIIDDVRFPNEADYILEGGVLFYLKRPAIKAEDNHESEQYFDQLMSRSIVIINIEGKIPEVVQGVYEALKSKKEVNL